MATTASSSALGAVATGVTRYRYVILAVLFAATFLNYLDRATLSVVADDIQREIGASNTEMGFIQSAFAWSVTAVIVFVGYLNQRLGTRRLGTATLFGFSAITAGTALATSFPLLVFFRLGLGVFEAPTFPLDSQLVRSWFPRSQRARAVGIYMTGSFVGLAFAVPLLGRVLDVFHSWRAVFVVAGAIGMLISLLWCVFVRNNPSECRRVSAEELALITGEPEPPAVLDPPRPDLRDWVSMLTDRRLIGIYLGAFGTSTVVFFFITWFPSYLKRQLHFDFGAGDAFYAALPFITGILGMIVAGILSDHLVKAGRRPGQARRIAVTIGLLGVMVIAVVPALDSTAHALIMSVLCVCFFFAGMANTAWVLPAEIAKPRLLGLTTGVYGFWVNLFGAATPIVVGRLLDVTNGNYGVVFGYVAVAALVGVIGYLVVVDKVEPSADARFP